MRNDTETPKPTRSEAVMVASTRTLVIGPYLTCGPHRPKAGEGAEHRSSRSRLDEVFGLAQAIDLVVTDVIAAPLSTIRPSTYLGKGKIDEITALVKAQNITLVILDCALSPVQQRNLERKFGSKVIDRTALILEIFGRRARTKEGSLQVELAHLAYQKGRLVRSWTHLERQRGGFGFLGGPGETQIEADRRQIVERMAKIERDLEKVKRTRGLHREDRRRVPHPTLVLVGYTNSGKSTLFNALTNAGVLAKNLLFATLDPTARQITLPHGASAILIDTVGFVSDLPPQLIAAFRATLEDVIEADVILHVRDIAGEDSAAQNADVNSILRSLGVGDDDGDTKQIVEVWNKIDELDGNERQRVLNLAGQQQNGPVAISALAGEGIPNLLARLEHQLSLSRNLMEVSISVEDGAGLAWLHTHTEVLSRREEPASGRYHFEIRVGPERRDAVLARFKLLDPTSNQAHP